MTIVLILLASAATYRITRLITADYLLSPLREHLEYLCEERGWHRASYLLNCDWCMSIWVAPLPACVVMFWPNNRALIFALLVLTFSAATGLASTLEKRLET
jgi:hypothetical protein